MPVRRSLFAFAIFSAMPLLVACPKKETPPPEAGPPPPPTDTTPTVLTPLTDDDAGADADAEAGPKKPTGPGVNPNVARLKQCCGALRAQAKALGASPEAGMLIGAAAQCDGLASQAGASGSAPELNVIKGLLGGRNVPPVCAGF
jgi:hypothetical protein